MESRQVVALTGAFVLFIGVFTPVVSVPTVGYMNYFQTAKVDGVVILGLATLSVLLLLAKQYRGLWFTGMASLGVLAFTFISLQIRISEIKDNLGVELAGNHSGLSHCWQEMELYFEDFTNRFLDHERTENALIQEAYERDLGDSC